MRRHGCWTPAPFFATEGLGRQQHLTATAIIINGCMTFRVYASCVRSRMIYRNETRPLLADVGLKFERTEMIRWLCGVSMKN